MDAIVSLVYWKLYINWNIDLEGRISPVALIKAATGKKEANTAHSHGIAR